MNNIIKYFTIGFPSAFMVLIIAQAFTDTPILAFIDWKGLIVLSLLALFPLFFLLQGILAAVTNTNILLSTGISTVTFIVLMFVYMNISAAVYIIMYLLAALIGYGITRKIVK